MGVATLRSAAAVAREVRRRVREDLPGLVRDVDVDLELDEDYGESQSTEDVSASATSDHLGTTNHLDRNLPAEGQQLPKQQANGHGFSPFTASRPLSSQRPSTVPSCNSEVAGGARHGSWGSEPCVSDDSLSNSRPEIQTTISGERRLQQVTLVWERGSESRQARVPTMRFEQGVRWTPIREGWREGFRENHEE